APPPFSSLFSCSLDLFRLDDVWIDALSHLGDSNPISYTPFCLLFRNAFQDYCSRGSFLACGCCGPAFSHVWPARCSHDTSSPPKCPCAQSGTDSFQAQALRD
ncbi:hypothetical protein V565_102340, partial [Rhizoctonia solani 123E]